ncbi:hypothetical protein JR316_0001525 [Psilocybe cubensis]|uniref:F-box domain-containing protein n=2 Tax=Psilocybe cubensis TaxID=181762 RepID=A0A8H7YBH1_PSICU|nr:hypothetical protein JR316_0001525 [Psilocybe cubensis]KAH9487449.1 hypothetical protein JR316_0001525 [Psilocybe cubensis]
MVFSLSVSGQNSLFTPPSFVRNELVLEETKAEAAILRISKATLHSLPVEIELHIFSQLELKPYLFSRGVCKEWQRLLPLADIHPVRRRLLELYLKMVNTPNFIDTRSWILENLQPFDRQAYIDTILSQYPAIPEEFRIWLLEWPERATINCIWPGLPFVSCNDLSPSRRDGVNWVAYKSHSPQLLAPVYRQCTPNAKFVPGLLIWRHNYRTEWLIFDKDEPKLFGRVYVIKLMEFQMPPCIPHERRLTAEDDEEDIESLAYSLEEEGMDNTDGRFNVPYPDWISYLESCWTKNLRRLEKGRIFLLKDDIIDESDIGPYFNGHNDTLLPAFSWSLRDSLTECLITS